MQCLSISLLSRRLGPGNTSGRELSLKVNCALCGREQRTPLPSCLLGQSLGGFAPLRRRAGDSRHRRLAQCFSEDNTEVGDSRHRWLAQRFPVHECTTMVKGQETWAMAFFNPVGIAARLGPLNISRQYYTQPGMLGNSWSPGTWRKKERKAVSSRPGTEFTQQDLRSENPGQSGWPSRRRCSYKPYRYPRPVSFC